MKRLFLAILMMAFCSTALFGQISIYPKVIFVDPLSKASYVRLVNETNDPREIELFTQFGFTDYDSLGAPIVQDNDSVQIKYSLVPFLKVFPRRLVIMPKKTQIVRLLISTPMDLADGTYHSRFIVRSKSVVKQKDSTAPSQIKTGISFYSDVGTVVIYEKGSITTDINVSQINSETDTSNVCLLMSVNKTGNSPFWGNAIWNITNSSGETIINQTEPIAFYNDATRRFTFKKNSFKPGRYKAELKINTEREDIPKERLIKKDEIVRTYDFVVP